MIDIQLDSNGADLMVDTGDLVIIKDDAAIRQSVLQRLRTFFGEWFLDTSVGLPYYQNILVKNPNLDLVQALVKNVVLTTPGITMLNQFQFDYNNGLRELSIEFSAKSTNGQTILVSTTVGA